MTVAEQDEQDEQVRVHLAGRVWTLAEEEDDVLERLALLDAGPVELRVVHEGGAEGVLVLRPGTSWYAVTGPEHRLRRTPVEGYPHI